MVRFTSGEDINQAKEKSKLNVVSFRTTIADPDHLRTMPLPAKGTITMGAVCGANLKVQGSLDNSAAVDAAFTAAQTIVSPTKGRTNGNVKDQ
jgi:hypothetical protein